jgi:2,4-dienoyl-CoA reductase-like NADH-dependent reductase (Old Yellow Enzyme family)/thioredoxin reductase
MQNMKYPKLFSPVRIGRLEIKNRVTMTAMGVNLAAAGGGVSDNVVAFYEARARGGVGLIVAGICRVMDGPGAAQTCQLAARNVGDLEGLERLANAVHKYGTRIFIQLQHPGGNYDLGPEQPVAASAVESLFGGQRTPRELSVPEIQEIQAAFVNGARIAQMAGADGVELHGAHGYLINSFLSPHLNQRNDPYGGNFENRLRFLREIVAGIRAACGEAFPLGVRLSVEEFLGDQGNDLAASCRIAAELETSGVDFIDVSASAFNPESPNFAATIEPGTYAQGWKKYMAAEIKQWVNIPVIAVANIKEPDVAEAILEEGSCDLVGVARGHLADPEWCNKAKIGKADTIRKCIGGLECFDEIEHHRHVLCTVNPVTGREREFAHPKRNGAERKVAVIGGGPAGITAALVLQERGFHPVLFDPSSRLGGTLNVAAMPIHREKIARLVDSLIAQVADSGIELRLGEEATVQKVQALSPCGVFVAWGALPFIPPVSGTDGENVLTAQDVLLGWAQAKGDCVIIGSGMTGLETAEFVLRGGHKGDGHKATVVDMVAQIGAGVEPRVIGDLMHRMAPYEPDYLPGHRLVRITLDGVDLESVATKQPASVPADTVILALGVRPRPDDVEAFKAAFPEARFVGDAVHGGRIIDATQDAYGKAFVFEPESNGTGRSSAMTEASESYPGSAA